MAMRAAAAVVVPRGLRRLFCSTPPSAIAAASASQTAEPNSTLFVSGLNKRTTSARLLEEFSKFGDVVHARVVTDRASGYSKGFGFVQYATIEEASKGIESMDGKFLDGWVIFAEYARTRPMPGQPVNNMSPQYGRPSRGRYGRLSRGR